MKRTVDKYSWELKKSLHPFRSGSGCGCAHLRRAALDEYLSAAKALSLTTLPSAVDTLALPLALPSPSTLEADVALSGS